MDTIGFRLMTGESIELELASIQCDMCMWLESGYQTSLNEGPDEGGETALQAYATEILLHRRMFHVSSADSPN